jgi:cbb3-type cytochrome oxidase subunit 3
MYTDFSIIGFLISILPLFLIIFILRWIRFIYQNSEKQVEQNEKIIELLMDIKEQNEKESR